MRRNVVGEYEQVGTEIAGKSVTLRIPTANTQTKRRTRTANNLIKASVIPVCTANRCLHNDGIVFLGVKPRGLRNWWAINQTSPVWLQQNCPARLVLARNPRTFPTHATRFRNCYGTNTLVARVKN